MLAVRLKSPVWQFFIKDSADRDYAICNVGDCSSRVKCAGGSTSALLNHLKHAHAHQHAVATGKAADATQPTLKFTSTARQAAWKSDDDKAANRFLVHWLARDLRPPRAIETRSFKRLISSLQPAYALPSRRTLMRTLLPAEYSRIKEQVVADLEDAPAIATTTDLWSSATSAESYFTLTAHWISSDWQLRAATLATRDMKVR
jgi:hypothetical protein